MPWLNMNGIQGGIITSQQASYVLLCDVNTRAVLNHLSKSPRTMFTPLQNQQKMSHSLSLRNGCNPIKRHATYAVVSSPPDAQRFSFRLVFHSMQGSLMRLRALCLLGSGCSYSLTGTQDEWVAGRHAESANCNHAALFSPPRNRASNTPRQPEDTACVVTVAGK